MTYSIIMISLALLLLIGVYIYPYVLAVIMKARMLRTLSRTAKENGFEHRRAFRHVIFTRNLSRGYDLIIYNEKKLYAIKLWSSYFAYNSLLVTREGKIREERRTRPVFSMGGKNGLYVGGLTHRVPKLNLGKKYAKDREVERITLIYPSYESIRAETGRGEVKLRTGDELFGRLIYSPSAFVNKLREKPREAQLPADN